MKPGWQTTEFWLGLVAAVATYLQAGIDSTQKGIYVTIIAVLYMVSRAWVKSNPNA